jgi:hypothetical protein
VLLRRLLRLRLRRRRRLLPPPVAAAGLAPAVAARRCRDHLRELRHLFASSVVNLYQPYEPYDAARVLGGH